MLELSLLSSVLSTWNILPFGPLYGLTPIT